MSTFIKLIQLRSTVLGFSISLSIWHCFIYVSTLTFKISFSCDVQSYVLTSLSIWHFISYMCVHLPKLSFRWNALSYVLTWASGIFFIYIYLTKIYFSCRPMCSLSLSIWYFVSLCVYTYLIYPLAAMHSFMCSLEHLAFCPYLTFTVPKYPVAAKRTSSFYSVQVPGILFYDVSTI